jgi:hypothetical protein
LLSAKSLQLTTAASVTPRPSALPSSRTRPRTAAVGGGRSQQQPASARLGRSYTCRPRAVNRSRGSSTSIFNLPDYRVISATVWEDNRCQIIVETDQPPGCPSCGVVATRRKERRFQRIRDIPVAGAVEELWSKYRWRCEERACPRLSSFESTAQVPRRARSTGRLCDHVVDAVISSGRAVSETAAAFAVS